MTDKRPIYSFEVFPPKPDTPIGAISKVLGGLSSLCPDYISITYGAGAAGGTGRQTIGLAVRLKNEYGIKPLVHLTAIHSSRKDVDKFIQEMGNSGLRSVLALRGDRHPGLPLSRDFRHASDLISYIKAQDVFNMIDISAACCPEGHIESKNIDDDTKYLKLKVDAGATHLNSQMCFDNEEFYSFLDRTKIAGIKVPIQAGIMPVVRSGQIERIIKLTGVKFPSKFSRIIARYADNPIALKDAGIAYATEQIIDLLTAGIDGVHLYVMNNVEVATRITEAVKSFR